MPTWYAENLAGRYLPAYAIVNAPDEQTARALLEEEFRGTHVEPEKGYILKKLKPKTAVILSDGDY